MTLKLDDLTEIKGIGTATAARLVNAGITSFALLAASSVDALGKVEGLAATKAAEWPAWIAEAAKRAAATEQGSATNSAGETGPTHTTPSESPKGGGGDPAPAAGARYSVNGPEGGRWRAGIQFGPEPRIIEVVSGPDAPAPSDPAFVQVDEDAAERIKADPRLSVRPA